MDRNKPKKSIISTGTTSIVLIFVMLSMLTFSVLSLTSAQANLRLSKLSAERTTEYYAAENAANDILIQVNDALEDVYPLAGDPNEFYLLAQDALEGMDIAFLGNRYLTYQVPLGERQVLDVELALTYDETDRGGHYTILSWQAVSSYDWAPDETLNLMSGGGFPIF